MTLSDVAAVILAYGQSTAYLAALEDALRAGVPAERIVVVHNPDRPRAGPPPAVAAGAQLVALDRNRGYAAAMNAGIARARSLGADAALLLTHDARLGADDAARLVAALAEHPRHAVLAPVLHQRSVRDEPSYGSRQFADGSCGPITRLDDDPAPVVSVPWVDGSAMLVRLAALPASEPLPEEYFMYWEEAHLCMQLRRSGWEVGSVLAAGASSAPGGAARGGAYAFLYARNGVDWMRRFADRGRAVAFARNQLVVALRDVLKPDGAWRCDAERRRRGLLAAIGRCAGLVAGALGHGGPPPAWLLRGSDIAYVR